MCTILAMLVAGFADVRVQDPVWKHRKDRNDTTTEPGFDYEAWKKKHMAFSDEAVPRWVDEVKLKYGKSETRYACVGLVPSVNNFIRSNIVDDTKILLWRSVRLRSAV